MPRARSLDPSDYPAAAAWLAKHGYDGVLPVDAAVHLDNDAWRALKTSVRAARHHAAMTGGDDIDRLLAVVQGVADGLRARYNGMSKKAAADELRFALADFRESNAHR